MVCARSVTPGRERHKLGSALDHRGSSHSLREQGWIVQKSTCITWLFPRLNLLQRVQSIRDVQKQTLPVASARLSMGTHIFSLYAGYSVNW